MVETMALKNFVKAVTPPILIELQRSVRGRQPLRFFWRGVYKSFTEVPTEGLGFRNSVWLNSTQAAAKQFMEVDRAERLISGKVQLAHSLLPLLATLNRQQGKMFKVLDFGGGMGVGYMAALECLPKDLPIEYHIVDNAETCRIGEELFRGQRQLYFHEAVPTALADVDVVYFSSSLQYVEDYPGLLMELSQLRAKFFLFVSLQAGENPIFVSGQINFEDHSVVPCWFFNLEEFLALMTSLQYELMYSSSTDRTYEMTNFDPPYRVPRYCNLLFADKIRGSKSQ